MAYIDYKDGFFWGVGTWAEKDIFKDAGFRWSPARRAWITEKVHVAEAVKGIPWDERAINQIEKRLQVAKISRDLSYEKKSDFDPPIPDTLLDKGWDFMGFQKVGIEYCTLRRDTLIADPPGLGKTIQAIGVSNCYPKRRRILVVCPASLKEMWRRTWLTWCTKGMSVGIAETRHREKFQDGLYKNGKPRFKTVIHPTWWPNTDVVIINYDILDRFAEQIHDQPWDILICDECHALKSVEATRTLFVLGGKQVRKADKAKGKKREVRWFNVIDAHRRIFLSGTPIMNRPIEFWPIIQAFDPDGLGRDYETFGYRYCDGYFDTTRGQMGAYNFTGASNKKELGQALRGSFMVRRNKREVLPELPPVFRQVILLDSPEIREVVAREDELAQALRLYEEQVLGNLTEDQRDRRIGEQIIDNAYKFGFHKSDDPDRPNSRAINLDYAAAVLGLEPPAVAVMFEEMASVRRELGIAKLTAVVPWVREFLETGEKLIVFGYHSDVVKALVDQLWDYEPAMIYGRTPLKKRQPEVDRFQEDERCRLMGANIDAAGVGFTMTRAKDVAFCEGDWVPPKMQQAEDRVCRIGQTATKIMSFYLVANGSLDSRIAQAAAEKDASISEVLDT